MGGGGEPPYPEGDRYNGGVPGYIYGRKRPSDLKSTRSRFPNGAKGTLQVLVEERRSQGKGKN